MRPLYFAAQVTERDIRYTSVRHNHYKDESNHQIFEISDLNLREGWSI